MRTKAELKQMAKARQAERGFSFSRPLMPDEVRSQVMKDYHEELKAWKEGRTSVQIFSESGDMTNYTYQDAVRQGVVKLGRSKLLRDVWKLAELDQFATVNTKTYKKGKNVGKKYFAQTPGSLPQRVVYNCTQPAEEFQNRCVVKCTDRTRRRTNACGYYGADVGNPNLDAVTTRIRDLRAEHLAKWRGERLKLTEEERAFIQNRRAQSQRVIDRDEE